MLSRRALLGGLSAAAFASKPSFAAWPERPITMLHGLAPGGGADIYGTLSSPRVGVGACSDGNVNALSSSGGATVNGHNPPEPGDIVRLPAAIVLPPPNIPAGVTGAYNGNAEPPVLVLCAKTRALGRRLLPASVDALTWWLCIGICCWVSVTFSAPPTSP